jgi:long-chain acyl-CoA synthetase
MVMSLDTLPKYLKHFYEKYGDNRIAMRHKDFGIWQEYSWKDYYENAKYCSLGLISLGLERGDKVILMGENEPEPYWAELGIMAAGGIGTGLFSDCMAPEVKYYAEHSQAKFAIVHDQEQVDKFLQVKGELPLLKKVIYWEPKGLWTYDDPILIEFNELVQLGREYDKLHPGVFELNIDQGKSEDLCFICYTSGTTGLPKGAMLPYRCLLAITPITDYVDKINANDHFFSFMPLAWIFEQCLGITAPLVVGATINLPESPETVQRDLRECGPTVAWWSPRNWESVNRLIQARMIDAGTMSSFLYRLFLPVGYKVANTKIASKKVNVLWRILNLLGYWTVFRPLRDKVGLSKVKKKAHSGGGNISPDIIAYFQAIGVDIAVGYGATECTLISVSRFDDIVPGTSGPPVLGGEVRISENGEIMAASPMTFEGYLGDPEATAACYKEGWLYTGDFGHISDDGHVIVMGRLSDVRMVKGGFKFSPPYTESRLRFSGFIKDAFVIGGEERDYIACIINIDVDNVGRWAEARRIDYTTFTDLSQKPQVIDLIKQEIAKVNKLLPEWGKISKFANLHKEFDPDEAELTRTRKLKRNVIEERFGTIIDALYTNVQEVTLATPITYHDGSTGMSQAIVKVNSLK